MLQDFGLNLYQIAESQEIAGWATPDSDYQKRCYDRASRLQAIANLLGFQNSHWQDFKDWNETE